MHGACCVACKGASHVHNPVFPLRFSAFLSLAGPKINRGIPLDDKVCLLSVRHGFGFGRMSS